MHYLKHPTRLVCRCYQVFPKPTKLGLITKHDENSRAHSSTWPVINWKHFGSSVDSHWVLAWLCGWIDGIVTVYHVSSFNPVSLSKSTHKFQSIGYVKINEKVWNWSKMQINTEANFACWQHTNSTMKSTAQLGLCPNVQIQRKASSNGKTWVLTSWLCEKWNDQSGCLENQWADGQCVRIPSPLLFSSPPPGNFDELNSFYLDCVHPDFAESLRSWAREQWWWAQFSQAHLPDKVKVRPSCVKSYRILYHSGISNLPTHRWVWTLRRNPDRAVDFIVKFACRQETKLGSVLPNVGVRI